MVTKAAAEWYCQRLCREDTFAPDDAIYITASSMAAMIVKAAKLTPAGEELAFTDSGSISGGLRSCSSRRGAWHYQRIS